MKHVGGTPWTVDDAPARFIAGQLRAIVGVELVITRVEAKRKLSQNRSAADVDGVVAGLRARGDLDSADEVERAQQEPGRPQLSAAKSAAYRRFWIIRGSALIVL